MRNNNLFNKTKAFLFAVVTAMSVTACSFTFDGNKVKEMPRSAIEYIAQNVSAADLSKESSVATLSKDINSIDGFIEATMVRVIDGDTIVVEINNSEYKVRMIGIDTPESVASEEYLQRTGKQNTAEGKTASEYTKALIDVGQTLYLQKDKSDTDRYGRLLRYVWTEAPKNPRDMDEIKSYMVNAMLVGDGYAVPVEYEPDTSYADVFEEIYEER